MSERTPSAIDAIADTYTSRLAELSPLEATFMGIAGHDHQMSDFSPQGLAEMAQLDRDTLAALAAAVPVDDTDRVTLAAMRDRLGLSVETYEAGEWFGSLNVIASPLQALRDVLDLMPTASVDDWANIAARTRLIPDAVRGYIASLREGVRRGVVPAQLQVDECIKQAAELADPSSSFFVTFAAGATPDGTAAAGGLANDLAVAGHNAAAAYGELVDFLSDELAGVAPAADAVGRERYALHSRGFVGAEVDLDETYAWAWKSWSGWPLSSSRSSNSSLGQVQPWRTRSRCSTTTRRSLCKAPRRYESGCRPLPMRPSPPLMARTSTFRPSYTPSNA